MSNRKSKLGLLAMMLALSSNENINSVKKEESKDVDVNKRLDRLKQQGVKEYYYGENVIYARNQKNADRKARNKGYLI